LIANRNPLLKLPFFVAAAATVFSLPAHAYLDPGTGSILLQGLIAGIMTVTAVLGIFWQRVKAFFASVFHPNKPSETSSKPESD
jgi:hypothetical protein